MRVSWPNVQPNWIEPRGFAARSEVDAVDVSGNRMVRYGISDDRYASIWAPFRVAPAPSVPCVRLPPRIPNR